MRKHFAPFLTFLALAAAIPALAGPDFQAIEAGRRLAAQRAAQDKAEAVQIASYAPGADGTRRCPPERLVLPLDHGPRALTTPGENRIRQARYEAQLKACQELAK